MNISTKTIKLFRIKDAVLDQKSLQDQVVVEQKITIQIDGLRDYTILCTPSDLKALVVGFLFAEGVVNSFADIIDISGYDLKLQAISVKLRSVAMICNITSCEQTLSFTATDLFQIMKNFHIKQETFKQTGGAHAAGIFDASGKIISFAEDIGRHNALDKAIGNCLLQNHVMHSCGVALSSRISFEMVEKAARAGLEMIVAVSAPSSLAIGAAKKWNITLCGFVRDGNANVYTGLQRLI